VATDLDFNVEGELKWGLSRNIEFKTNFMVSVKRCLISFCNPFVGSLRMTRFDNTPSVLFFTMKCLIHVCALFARFFLIVLGSLLFSLQHTQQQQMLSGELNFRDEWSTAQAKMTRAGGGDELQFSVMHSVFPNLALGGA
jgi:hypothetical protein